MAGYQGRRGAHEGKLLFSGRSFRVQNESSGDLLHNVNILKTTVHLKEVIKFYVFLATIKNCLLKKKLFGPRIG